MGRKRSAPRLGRAQTQPINLSRTASPLPGSATPSPAEHAAGATDAPPQDRRPMRVRPCFAPVDCVRGRPPPLVNAR